MINTENPWLLMIEPPASEKAEHAINDAVTEMMEDLLSNGVHGVEYDGKVTEGERYRGWHRTDCGENSGSQDIQVGGKFVTNSLAAFYLRYYRNSIPQSEIAKLRELASDQGIDISGCEGFN